jgi:teichuronic acid biosynthesis glycosyltransferase TuaC
MQLLVICPVFPSEDDRYIGSYYLKEQVMAIARTVDRVHVICPVPITLGLTSLDRYCRDYSFDNVDVHFPRYLHLVLPKRDPSLADRFARKDSLAMVKAVEKTVAKYDLHYDLVHDHFTWPCGQVAEMLKAAHNTPFVLTVHENEGWLRQEISSTRKAFPSTWRAADLLIRVNEKNLQDLRPFNAHVEHIPNGFDDRRYRPIDRAEARSRLGIDQEAVVLFTLGNLIRRKGYDHLIKAVGPLIKRDAKVCCYIGGKGPQKKELEALIALLGMRDNIILLGQVPQDQMNDWLNACDLYVQPSLSESFGVVQLSALGAGIPVVATLNGGSEEIITSPDYGVLCPPGDDKALRNAVVTALDKKWDQGRILEYASTWTWDAVAKRIVALYDRTLE